MGFYCVRKPRLSVSSWNCACKCGGKNTSTNEDDCVRLGWNVRPQWLHGQICIETNEGSKEVSFMQFKVLAFFLCLLSDFSLTIVLIVRISKHYIYIALMGTLKIAADVLNQIFLLLHWTSGRLQQEERSVTLLTNFDKYLNLLFLIRRSNCDSLTFFQGNYLCQNVTAVWPGIWMCYVSDNC